MAFILSKKSLFELVWLSSKDNREDHNLDERHGISVPELLFTIDGEGKKWLLLLTNTSKDRFNLGEWFLCIMIDLTVPYIELLSPIKN